MTSGGRSPQDAADASQRRSVLIATWASGGNLPPLLALAGLLREAGHRVRVLASSATLESALRAGLDAMAYRTAPPPDASLPFEAQMPQVLRTLAGVEIASDVRAAVEEARPDLLVADCMLPAAIVAGQSASIHVVSLVHFLYGPARAHMERTGDAWTTDLASLSGTRAHFGLPPVTDWRTAWEAVDLLLVTAPPWFDLDTGFPANVVHAGPLGVRVSERSQRVRPLVALSFSTTEMHGQAELIERVCDALTGQPIDAVLTLGGLSQAPRSARKNVEVVAFAEHDELFPHCEAVVTHGGLGTVLRALTHGVPLLMLPLGRDQHVNSARVAELGAGIELSSDAPPRRIREALEHLTATPGFRQAAAAAAARIASDEPDRSALHAVVATQPP